MLRVFVGGLRGLDGLGSLEGIEGLGGFEGSEGFGGGLGGLGVPCVTVLLTCGLVTLFMSLTCLV